MLRIPRSWNLPHMVTFKNLSRFYSRNSAGKYQLDIVELRNLFSITQTISERIQSFRAERIGNILAKETPIPLNDSPKIILHIIPLSAFDPTSIIDISTIKTVNARPIGASGWSGRYNFDGYVTYEKYPDSPTSHSYVQIFRNGIIEAIDAMLIVQ